MASKPSRSIRQSSTGSYTVSVHRSASTGRFVSTPRPTGKIIVNAPKSEKSTN